MAAKTSSMARFALFERSNMRSAKIEALDRIKMNIFFSHTGNIEIDIDNFVDIKHWLSKCKAPEIL